MTRGGKEIFEKEVFEKEDFEKEDFKKEDFEKGDFEKEDFEKELIRLTIGVKKSENRVAESILLEGKGLSDRKGIGLREIREGY